MCWKNSYQNEGWRLLRAKSHLSIVKLRKNWEKPYIRRNLQQNSPIAITFSFHQDIYIYKRNVSVFIEQEINTCCTYNPKIWQKKKKTLYYFSHFEKNDFIRSCVNSPAHSSAPLSLVITHVWPTLSFLSFEFQKIIIASIDCKFNFLSPAWNRLCQDWIVRTQ